MVSRIANPLTPPSIKRLSDSLPPDARRLLRSAIEAATTAGIELWAVGGPVRDAALGRQLVDIDLAARDGVPTLAASLAARFRVDPNIEARFGTASLTVEGRRLDLATLRTERYRRPGALPTVTLHATLEADLARRDFTVNALALALSGPARGRFVDPARGLDDLTHRRLRVLHSRSFQDDATRLWRAARLTASHGLRPDPATLALIEEGASALGLISGDRLWAELCLVAARGRAARTLATLDRWGALRGTHTAFRLTPEARRALAHRTRPLPAARLVAVLLGPLDPAAANSILDRFNAPPEARHAVAGAHRLIHATPTLPDPADFERLEHTSEDARTAAAWLAPETAPLLRALRRWERTRPHLAARELMRLGVPEGPEIGRLLRCLRRGRYVGTLASATAARAHVRNAIEESRPSR